METTVGARGMNVSVMSVTGNVMNGNANGTNLIVSVMNGNEKRDGQRMNRFRPRKSVTAVSPASRKKRMLRGPNEPCRSR